VLTIVQKAKIFKNSFVSVILVLNLIAGSSPQANAEAFISAKNDPVQNVLLIIGDDHSKEVVGSYGNDIVRTPEIDRFATEGVQFNNAYTNAPLCSASRQSLLTGKYPHATGVTLLFTPFQDNKNETVAEQLRQHGFKTAAIGKMHFNNWIWGEIYKEGPPDHGFDIRVTGRDHERYLEQHPPREIPEGIETWSRDDAKTTAYRKNARTLPQPCFDKDCEGTYFANKTVELMKENKDNRFFITVGFHEPHAPFNFPIEYEGKYDPQNMPLPEGSPEDDRWIPEQFKDLTEEERRGIIASYYTSTEYLDKNVGIILNGLKDLGLEENTLVIYVGDHGYLLNDHKRFEKHTMWEESIKAPFILKAGDRFGSDREIDELMEFIDITPTILDIAGVPKMEEIQGKSLLPLLQGETEEHKEYVFAEFLEDNKAMVAFDRWKYIFSSGIRDLGQSYATGKGAPGITHRLYDLKNDPGETTNVAHKPENQEILRKMQLEMLETFKETAPYADQMPTNMTLEGKLVWFCYPRDVGANPADVPSPLRVFEKN
jgi:arylsulfatase A-like enzyme